MAQIKFKRNEHLLVTHGEFAGKRVKFIRLADARDLEHRRTAKSLTVELLDDCGDYKTGTLVSVGVHEVIKSARKIAKKQASRLILAYCPECDYKIRASASMFLRGVPACPTEECTRNGEPFEVDWPDVPEEVTERKTQSNYDAITRMYQRARKGEK